MSNLQSQDDKVLVQAGQIKQVDKLVLDIKREYGSVRAFSAERVMPIVTYTASADGTTPMEACTDLALLRPDAVAEFQKILSEHHNSKLLKLISELSHLLNDLYGSLDPKESPREHFSEHPNYGDLEEFGNES